MTSRASLLFFIFFQISSIANDDKPSTTPNTKVEMVNNTVAAVQQKVITDTKMPCPHEPQHWYKILLIIIPMPVFMS